MDRPKLVAFVGPDGAGKSTQCKRALQWLNEKGVRARVLDKWDILDPGNHALCDFVVPDRGRLQEAIAEMEAPARPTFLFWMLYTSLEPFAHPGGDEVYLVDGYWAKHAAAEKLFGTSVDLLDRLVAMLPVPDLTLYFRVEPGIATRRKAGNLTTYECGAAGKKDTVAFRAHQDRLSSEMNEYARAYRWPVIDAGRQPDVVWTAVEAHLQSLVQC